MARPSAKTNPNLVGLIEHLRKESARHQAPIWRELAARLEKPSRLWAEVNLSALDRYAKENETVVIPGKLLGAGATAKKLIVAAFKASGAARKQIAAAGGQFLTLEELVSKNPKGSGVRLMG